MTRCVALAAPTLALLALATSTALSTPPSAEARGCKDKTLVPNGRNASRVRAATRCLVNVHRRKHGLKSLRAHRELRRAAQRYSRRMVRERFFDHVAPDGSTLTDRVERTRYLGRARKWWLGEDLGWGVGADATALTTVRRWMASPAHREQILNRRYREAGVGVSRTAPSPTTGERGVIFSLVFGGRSRR